MEDLEEYRQSIDILDQQIVELFEQRLNLVLQVAKYKQKNNLAILQADREEEVVKKVVGYLANPEYQQEVIALYRSMLQISRHLQQQKILPTQSSPPKSSKLQASTENLAIKQAVVGYQGVAGSFSEEALIIYFGEENQRKNYSTFEEVCLALDKQEIDFGILPIENTSTGSVNDVYDLLLKYGCFIVGEQSLAVQQHLLGLPGAKLELIKEVYSHAQGLAQCSDFLKKYSNWRQIPYQNTAVSAKMVKEKADLSKAAIASKRAAKLYGLNLLQTSINDQKDNHTLFIIIGRDLKISPDDNKVSVIFKLENQFGGLARLLNIFAEFEINMTKIESRPVQYRPWEYVFYANFEGSDENINMLQALKKAKENAKEFRILGSYKSINYKVYNERE